MKNLRHLFLLTALAAIVTVISPLPLAAQETTKKVAGKIILRMAPAEMSDSIMKLPGSISIKPLAPHFDTSLMLLRYDSTVIDMDAMLSTLRKLSFVQSAEPAMVHTIPGPVESHPVTSQLAQRKDKTKWAVADGLPGDSLFSLQWGLESIRMPELWQVPLKSGAKRPVIAIIDSGIDTEHPDLKANLWVNEAELNGLPGVDDDGNGFIDDIQGWNFYDDDNDVSDCDSHGTECAGIAAAVADNGIGIAGTNPDALIMPLRVAWVEDNRTVATNDDIIAAIDYAIAMGADVISLSMGKSSKTGYEYLEQACKQIIIVAAAGNEEQPINSGSAVCYPAAYSGVIGVEASDEAGGRPSWSNYDDDGPWISTFESGENYEVRAPGDEIVTTAPGGEYVTSRGTSMATPFVAGLVSRLISVKDYASHDELIRDLVLSRGGDLGDVDAMKAYTGLSQEAALQIPRRYTLWKDMDERIQIRNISAINLSDSTLTGLHAVMETVSPADSSSIQILQPLQQIPSLQPGEIFKLQDTDWIYTMKEAGEGDTSNTVRVTLYNWDEALETFTMEMPLDVDSYYEGGFMFKAIDDESVMLTEYIGADSCIIPATVLMNGKPMAVRKINMFVFDIYDNYGSVEHHLRYVYLPDGLKEIGASAFCDCKSLKTVRFPEGLEKIGGTAFFGCKSLTEALLPDGLKNIEESAFLDCDSLQAVSLPEGLESIGEFAFSGCASLTEVRIPESMKEIEVCAFATCSALRSLQFDGAVEKVGELAFAGCDSLRKITSLAVNPYDYDEEIFDEDCTENAVLYVPYSTTDNYRATTCWGSFKNIVELSPTHIVTTKKDDSSDPSSLYDLSGRRIRTLVPGIVIQNGKKLFY